MRVDDLNQKEYEIVDSLGGNALFTTFLARQVNLGRHVVIRLIHSDEERLDQRFANELSALATLTHPNNRRVVDAGAAEIDGHRGPYVVFDYLHGDLFETGLAQTRFLETSEVIRVARQVLGALAEAHRNGVLHRQLSPRSMMVCQHHGQPDHLALIDFALEHSINPERWLEHLRQDPIASAYAAPEVLAGEPPTLRSDLFSAASILYHAAVGAPFSPVHDTDIDVNAPSADRLMRLRPELISAIDYGLAGDPRLRYGSALEFLDALSPLFERAHSAAIMPASMSSYTVRPVFSARAERSENPARLSDTPTVWIIAEDPALDPVFLSRIKRSVAHYDVAVVASSDVEIYAHALASGELEQPWVVVFGDIHVIMQNGLLAVLRDLPVTQRLLVSAKLNGQMLDAAVNFCGVDRHILRPVSDESLSGDLEELMADCRRQLLRQQAQSHRSDANGPRLRRRQSLTGTFAAETR